MDQAIESPEIPIIETQKFREIGIEILDGGNSAVVLTFCPWCGFRFPESLRDRWFDELERRNIDPYGTEIPDEFLTSEWHREL
jgi:hypothetical protein